MAPKRKRRGRKRRKPVARKPGVVTVTEVNGPGGRPSLYSPQMAEDAYAMAAGGATDAEMAEKLGIDIGTFYTWRHLHLEFLKATRLGKEIADERVVNSMYSRANGHRHKAVKIFLSKDGEVVYAPYTEILPPDTAAGRLWLLNRDPERWKDKQDIAVDADVKIVVKGGLPDGDDK